VVLSKILKTTLKISLGFFLGIIFLLLWRSNHPPLVEVSIENKSDVRLKNILINDDELQNNYFVENLNPGDSRTITMYCSGEIGYTIKAEFDNGDELSANIYSETGYRDYFEIMEDTIIHTKFGKSKYQ
jgi:hypothetical protein